MKRFRRIMAVTLMLVAGALAAGALAPNAAAQSASSVQDLMAQYPDGGDALTAALSELYSSDPVGTAQAIRDAWTGASEAQRAAILSALGGGCTGNSGSNNYGKC